MQEPNARIGVGSLMTKVLMSTGGPADCGEVDHFGA